MVLRKEIFRQMMG
jgi:hypothetical protein